MKFYTHIYLATKAMEFTRKSVNNMWYYKSNRPILRSTKDKERYAAKDRKYILKYYQDFVEEASWAPDYILHDNDPYHIFKLFTEKEFTKEDFPNKKIPELQTFEKDNVKYYKFSGGLPFRADHIAQSIISMSKLRRFNDQFTMQQLMYYYLLLSHYVVDAHVPMHCDLRDDPPDQGRNQDPSRSSKSNKPKGKYMKPSAHMALEGLWDKAVIPVAIREEIFDMTEEEKYEETEYSKYITFKPSDCNKNGKIKTFVIQKGGLMDFMIDICIKSKIRCQKLFPMDNPNTRRDEFLKDITEEIFADCIGNLMSVWAYIWRRHQD